ncbi:hypothetical protein [Streptomyces misionensis]|uniref:hypothetical protein n=1 Tax=Streptomyces misionensis TaxID=67331 RepID=UPI0036AC10F5
MTQPNAREQIENLWDRATPVGPLLDAYRAHNLREGLTAAERQFLRFALDLAEERMVYDDGFTVADERSLVLLQQMAEEQP